MVSGLLTVMEVIINLEMIKIDNRTFHKHKRVKIVIIFLFFNLINHLEKTEKYNKA